jgi:hypothetical protein
MASAVARECEGDSGVCRQKCAFRMFPEDGRGLRFRFSIIAPRQSPGKIG